MHARVLMNMHVQNILLTPAVKQTNFQHAVYMQDLYFSGEKVCVDPLFVFR